MVQLSILSVLGHFQYAREGMGDLVTCNNVMYCQVDSRGRGGSRKRCPAKNLKVLSCTV